MTTEQKKTAPKLTKADQWWRRCGECAACRAWELMPSTAPRCTDMAPPLTKEQWASLDEIREHSPCNPFRTGSEMRAREFQRLSQLGLAEMSRSQVSSGWWVWITKAGRAALKQGDDQ